MGNHRKGDGKGVKGDGKGVKGVGKGTINGDPDTGDALLHIAVNTEQYKFALMLIDKYGINVDVRTAL